MGRARTPYREAASFDSALSDVDGGPDLLAIIPFIGNALDSWGGISAADLMNPAFAIGVQAADFGVSAIDTYSIDSVALTVYTASPVPGLGSTGALLCIGAVLGVGCRACSANGYRLGASRS